MRWVSGKEARIFFAEKNAGIWEFTTEELPEESRKGLFRFSNKNKIETQPQRALGVARGMGTAGEEDRFFSQDHPQFFHFLFDLPELRGHKGKSYDCFRGSCFPGYLLYGTGKMDVKIPVQAFPLEAAEDHREGVPVFPGLPENQIWTLISSQSHIFLYSFVFALSKEK
jgi:hypothetical protein